MPSLMEKPAEKAETQQAATESKSMAERPRHPLLSLPDEIGRLLDFEPFRRFESAFSGDVPTAEVAEKENHGSDINVDNKLAWP